MACITAFVGGLVGAATISLIIGTASSMAKQAFDAIVQRDAPDANRGRSFARFETRFQLLWVIGALIPILIPIPAEIGYVLIAAVATFAVISYLVGVSRVRKGLGTSKAAPVEPTPTASAGPEPAAPSSNPPRARLHRPPPDLGARRWATAASELGAAAGFRRAPPGRRPDAERR